MEKKELIELVHRATEQLDPETDTETKVAVLSELIATALPEHSVVVIEGIILVLAEPAGGKTTLIHSSEPYHSHEG